MELYKSDTSSFMHFKVIRIIEMASSTVKLTIAFTWFFGSLWLGLAQDVSNNYQTGGLNSTNTENRPRFLKFPGFEVQVGGKVGGSRSPIEDLFGFGVSASIGDREGSSTPTTSPPQQSTFCHAPPQPANGGWEFGRHNCGSYVYCSGLEGSPLGAGTQLLYRCHSGYKVEGNIDVYCREGGQLSPIPKCVEVRCASLNSVSTTTSCTRFGRPVSCDSSVLPHTRAEVSCRPGYTKDTDFVSIRRIDVNCNADGEWDPEPIRCVPARGQAITHQQPFVAGGTRANLGDFPWHATLYQEVEAGKEKRFQCGATIIHRNLLLTAAHCVYDENYETKQDPSKLFVATGNVFRDYDSPLHDLNVVRKAAVKNVYTHCQYYGRPGNYASDIALLELHEPFQLFDILMPACLDASEHRYHFLESGAIGKVAGFGNTALGKPSALLQTLTLPFVPHSECKTPKNAAENKLFISSDKFCAGYTNGSAVCEGDSGGGLVFQKHNLWHVMGIVSVGLGVDDSNGGPMCDKHAYTLYTDVSRYMEWIQAVLITVERNRTYPACSNQSP